MCGAPLIPNGRVYPLKPQYELEETIVVQCNSQYSFPDETVETIGVCQGYNLWEPPVPPCVCRYKSDVFKSFASTSKFKKDVISFFTRGKVNSAVYRQACPSIHWCSVLTHTRTP